MEAVGVRELRQYLSVYLRRVKAGEALRVTEHGRVVATLQPAHPSDDPLDHLTAAGLLDPPTVPFQAPVPAAAPEGTDLATLVESDRDDRLQ